MIKLETYEKIRSIFYESPTKGFKLRELSRLANLAPKSLYVYLDYFICNKFVKKKDIYGLKLYLVDFDSEKYKLDKINYNVDKIRNCGLIGYLNKVYDYPVIILFGSKSKGEDIETSDFDIAVISSLKISVDIEKYAKELGSEIQLFVFNDFNNESNELKNNIINGIILDGYIEVF